MATYFQSFWTSSMPKRLLRYALTKLDYFDTDALDLDNFEMAWGKSGYVTWQDVGIKIEKLDQLLQLPPSIEIQKAKVLVLRAHLPSSIYVGNILVEADGIEIKLKVNSQEDPKAARRGRTKNAAARHTEQEDPVPHTIDLAQSFLETQPQKEKAELQAALTAEGHDLAASTTSSDTGSEEDLTLGTGQALSLPAFLADFLDGLIDRVQLTIKGVTCQMDIDVPVESNSSVNELVTFQLAIDEINAEGVTMQPPGESTDRPGTMKHKPGKRLVELTRIRACLISEANVFSALSRSPSIPSSVVTGSPIVTSRQPMSREPTGITGISTQSQEHLGTFTDDPHHDSLMDSEDAFNIPYDLSGPVGSLEDDQRSAPSTPRALAPRTPPHDAPRDVSRIGPGNTNFELSLESPLESERMLSQLGDIWGGDSMQSTRDDDDNSPAKFVGLDLPSPSPNEELAESHLFSHEEAESMYMSAFSHADDLPQAHQAMPGAWDSDPSSAENSPNARTKPVSMPAATTNDGSSSSLRETQPRTCEPDSPVDNLDEAVHSRHDSNDDLSGSRPDSLHEHDLREDDGAEGTKTPKGPARLAKELVSLSGISMYLPSAKRQPVPTSSEDPAVSQSRSALDRSIAANVPGAFSVYAGTPATTLTVEKPTSETPETPMDQNVEVILSPLDIHIDLATGFLLSMVISRILAALREPPARRAPGIEKEKSSPAHSNIKIAAEEISVYFLERLSAVAECTGQNSGTVPTAFAADALLTASLKDLNIGVSQSQSSTVTSLDLGKFKFGYGNDDIVSFDQRIQMRASVRDALPSSGSDLSATITQSPEYTRCEMKSLPLHVKLDLQRLDETFSWFGGLSSFLNMSSSMTSSSSPTPRSPTKPPRKPRGVRFDAPIRPEDTSANSDNKVNMRIGGFRLDLLGKDCSVSLDTSAVKLVSREEGIGLGISKIHLAGPYMRGSMADPPINSVITNTRVEFLVTPKNNDLERLLELIIPSKHKFDQNDDEIMVDTLLRQRRKGSVLRVNIDDWEVNISRIQQLQVLPALGEEVARLSTVAKYLPEDDRPGLLTLALIRNMDVMLDVGGRFGCLKASLKDFEVGHITVPSLVALGVGTISVRRNRGEELVGSVVPPHEKGTHGPVLTLRIIGDEMEPVVKFRLRNLNIEYRVPTVMDLLGLAEDITPQEYDAALTASVANLGEQAHATITGKQTNPTSKYDKRKGKEGKPTKVDIVFRDCLLGLNPLGLSSKLVVVLTDSHFELSLSNGDDAKGTGYLNKASILLIDDVAIAESGSSSSAKRRVSTTSTPQVLELCQRGYVDICYISSARAEIQVTANREGEGKHVDVELRDDLLVLETCADSTQTLIALANALAPPTPPSKAIKYQTKVVPVKDMLASISADAFGKAEGDYDLDIDFGFAQELGVGSSEDISPGGSEGSSPLDVDSQFYDDSLLKNDPVDPADSMLSERTTAQDTNDGVLLTNFNSQPDELDDEELDVHENFFGSGSAVQDKAHRWSSARNRYDHDKVQKGPFSLRVQDVHFIWNLFDGYDWDRTRDVISKAVYDIEATATERQSRQDRARTRAEVDTAEEETVIGDFLFNSIYIGIPANRDPRELAQAINQELNDNATETESIATTAMTATPSRQGGAYRTKKKLRLHRSKRHKITFELKGINADLVTFPPNSGETQSSIDVRIRDLDIFDHVPTSTWKKFATYDQDAGEREMGASMVHLEVLNVKPVPALAASEIVLTATVLPLRLHVDQDALDFITRFFEFKDDSAPAHGSPSDIPFVQRAEVNSIPVKLDFKPKRVDYAGLRSGHTTEFMNFVVLDQARMILRHTIIYGVLGFDKLGKMLNDIWMPDVKRNQLPGVLAGLAPVRSLVNVGSGFKDLVEIPIKEYKKDGRIVRSIGKGAAAFAKTTGTEIVRLGAKLAVGTQYALQGAEDILVKQPEAREPTGWDDEEPDTEETKQISLYADQPTGVVQGLRGAYSSLARDLNVARDAIIAVPGEVIDSQGAHGAAKAVLKRAPTIIFRPLIGSSKAIGQTLMGATNSLDPQNRRRMDEKYKKH